MRASANALRDARSYRFEVQEEALVQGIPAINALSQSKGVYRYPDDLALTATMSFMVMEQDAGFGDTYASEMVRIGGVTYYKDSYSKQWVIVDSTASMGMPVDVLANYEEFVADQPELSLQVLDQESVYYLSGILPADIIKGKQILNEAPAMLQEVRVEFWIGVEDYLPRKATVFVRFEIPPSEYSPGSLPNPGTSKSDLRFSDFGNDFMIQPPPEFANDKLLEGDDGNIVNISLAEAPYRFLPDTLVFEEGKTYQLVFSKPSEFHTFTVDQLGVNIFISPGELARQKITFSKGGQFVLFCLVHEALGMKGTVTVKP